MDNIYSNSKFIHHPEKLSVLKAGGQPTPVHLQLIISDFCNHDCAFCAYRMSGYSSNEQFQIEPGTSRKARNPKRFIPLAKCLEIIDDAVDMDVKAVQFSLWGKESVPIVDSKNNTESLYIGDFVDSCFSKPYAGGYEKKRISGKRLYTYAINDDGALRKGKITHVYRHLATEDLWRVKLADGRTVIVTGSHSLNIVRDGKIQKIPVKDATINDSVACAVWDEEAQTELFSSTPIQAKSSEQYRKLNKEVLHNADLFRLLGYHTAEGTANRRGWQNMIGWVFGNTGRELFYIDDCLKCIRSIWGVDGKAHDMGNKQYIKLFSKAVYSFFEENNMVGVCNEKGIPHIIWAAARSLKIEYLKGLFAGDGNFRATKYRKGKGLYNRNSLHLKTSSRLLANDVYMLLRQIGCRSTIIQGKNKKRFIDGRELPKTDYWTVNVNDKDSLDILCDVLSHLGSKAIYTDSVYSMAGRHVKPKAVMEGGAEIVPIKSIGPIPELGRPVVYDITVESEGRFITSSGIGCFNTGGGEPTVHPEFLRIAQYCIDRGIEAALVTNGSMLHKPEYRAVIRQMSWVRISIDAGTPETYCETRGVGRGMWDSVLDGIKRLCEESDDTIIGIGYVATPDNWREIHDGVRLFKELGVSNVRLGLMFNPEGSKPFEEFRYDLAHLALKAEEDFADDSFAVINRVSEKMGELDAGNPKFKTCWYQHLTSYIGGNQVAYRCCVQAYNSRGAIGSIHNRRFKDLWDSEEKKEDMASFDARQCERCQFTEIIENIDDYIKHPPLHANFV